MTASTSKKLGLGLGYFSIALGALEVAAPRRVARALGLSEEGAAPTTIRAFGLREIAAGVMLLRGPAVSFNVWNRVLGDAMDTYALLAGWGSSKKKGAMAGALAFVGGAAALDLYTAKALERDTGRTLPVAKPDEQL
jgi:hypothetical protein